METRLEGRVAHARGAQNYKLRGRRRRGGFELRTDERGERRGEDPEKGDGDGSVKGQGGR